MARLAGGGPGHAPGICFENSMLSDTISCVLGSFYMKNILKHFLSESITNMATSR